MKRIFKIVICAIGGIAIMALVILGIMWLWNLIVPVITGWKAIDFWQALGLTVLARLLTGHFALPKKHGGNTHSHLHEIMGRMSREERKTFIKEKLETIGREETCNGKATI